MSKKPITDESLLTPATDQVQATQHPQKQEAKAPAESTAGKLARMQKLFDSMSPEEREQLQRLGISLPSGDISSALNGHYRWGLRCCACNQVALFFVGTEFRDNNTGATYEQPQSWMPHYDLSWTQNLPIHEIDRVNPKCQHCGQPVEMQGDQCFRFDRRLIQVEAWQASRDAAYDRKVLDALRRKVATVPDVVTMPDGKMVALSDQVRREVVNEVASQVLRRTRPGALEDIEAVEKQLGGNILAALAAEQPRR